MSESVVYQTLSAFLASSSKKDRAPEHRAAQQLGPPIVSLSMCSTAILLEVSDKVITLITFVKNVSPSESYCPTTRVGWLSPIVSGHYDHLLLQIHWELFLLLVLFAHFDHLNLESC